MVRWKRGDLTIQRLLDAGELDLISKAAADGTAVLDYPWTIYSEAVSDLRPRL